MKYIYPARSISLDDVDEVVVDFSSILNPTENLVSSGLSVTSLSGYVTISSESINSEAKSIDYPDVTVQSSKSVVFNVTGSSKGNEEITIDVSTSSGRTFNRKIKLSVI